MICLRPACCVPCQRRPAPELPTLPRLPLALALAALLALPATAAARGLGDAEVPPRAPSGPPLEAAGQAEAEPEEEAAEADQQEGDPLVGNGLVSPACSATIRASLPQAERRDCEASAFVAAPAPTGHYGIDIHINHGLTSTTGWLLSEVQDLVVQPVWTALVWAVHALLVMLEWCFSLNLLRGGPAAELQLGLLQERGLVTEAWLPLAFAVAAVAVAWNGLVRRRVADSLAETLLMAGMIAGGLWLVSDPGATVGWIGALANQAGLGSFAVASSERAQQPASALAAGLASLYATTIEGPWCYLEFGSVQWCREPSQLEPALHRAALQIAANESASGEASTAATKVSVALLRDANTNGDLFLALPANGPQRNSINDQGSLLRTICQSSDATDCSGPAAAEAEFRTDGGTWPRVAGLLLIAAGLLGFLLLVGYIAVRLLTAATHSVLYLLVAPAILLAPALGEWGRGVFRAWLARLLIAFGSKLLFAFLLGVLLASTDVILSLDGIGWWAQWLLLSTFWWSLFLHRHTALGAGSSGRGRSAAPVAAAALRRRAVPPEIRQEATAAAGSTAAALGGGEAPEDRPMLDPGPRFPEGPKRPDPIDGQALRLTEADQAEAEQHADGEPLEPARGLERSYSKLLDAEADKPDFREADKSERRDYRALAGLAGHTPAEYDDLPGAEQRQARLTVDRELRARRKLGEQDLLPDEKRPFPGHEPEPPEPPAPEPPEPRPPNPVWEDIQAVASGRKKQLGIGKP